MTAQPHEYVRVQRLDDDPFVQITMNRPGQRNALSLGHLRELLAAFRSVAGSDATGVVLAGEGPVFSAGHDFRDLAGAPLDAVRELVGACSELMLLLTEVPQVVIARVHGLATAA